ncbi:MAG: hypothetical protein IPP56_16440 [Bacteroidetes bacterium]|nr:hypothetical protein [Bacteroidota bacterium]MBK9801235.1 hypothetical protein [Bacteroidota bacterium]
MDKKLLECILNIDMLTTEMMDSIHGLYKHKIRQEEPILKTVVKYDYILICSFMDELDIINSYAKDNALIKDIMWCISPLLKVLRSYDGIRKGRNALFAHYNRDKKNNFFPWWRSLNGVKLPRTINEIAFLNAILGCIRAVLVSQYIDEVEELKRKYKNEVDDYLKYVENQENIALQGQLNTDVLIKEVDRRTKEKNILIRRIL